MRVPDLLNVVVNLRSDRKYEKGLQSENMLAICKQQHVPILQFEGNHTSASAFKPKI